MKPTIGISPGQAQVDPGLLRLAGSEPTGEERAEFEEAVARAHLPMARRLASRFMNTGAEFDDLAQVAGLALVKAIRRFDPEQGNFEKFAYATINGELKNYVRDQCWDVRTPRRLQTLYSEIGIATEALAQATGEVPTITELAQELGAGTSEISEALETRSCFRALSLDQPIDSSGHCLADTLPGEHLDFDSVNNSLELADLLKDLNHQERRMIWLRFVDGRSQDEIAKMLGMTQIMVSRRLSVLLAHMRARARRAEVA